MTALAVKSLCKSFGGLRVTANVELVVEPGERRLIIGPNGAGKTTLFNLITGEITPDSGSIALFGRDITHAACRNRAHLGLGADLPDHHAVPPRHHPAQREAGAAGPSPLRWNPFVDLDREHGLSGAPAMPLPRSASATLPSGRWRRPPTANAAASRSPWRWRRTRKSSCSTSPSPACPSMSGATCRNSCSPSRAT